MFFFFGRPMKLDSLDLANCGGFEQLSITFDPQITVIAGVNGVGKSTILKALATLFSQALPEFTPCRSKVLHFDDDKIHTDKPSLEVSAKVSVPEHVLSFGIQRIRGVAEDQENFLLLRQSQLSATKKNFHELLASRTLTGDLEAGMADTRKVLADQKTKPNPPLAIYFSPARQLPGKPKILPAEIKPFEPAQAYGFGLHDRQIELREFMHWFRTQEKLGVSERPNCLKVLEALRQVVTKLMPEFSNLRIEESPRLAFMVDKRGKPFALHQLSDGERSLLALVFDLTRRLAIANPESDDPIGEGVALVMIDEIELHLHPKWQRDVLHRLLDAFKACQFVVTTHSPQVLGEVDAKCVRLLSVREGKIVCDTPSMALGADSNWILNVLMEASDQNQGVSSKIDKIAALISRRDLESASERIAKLRSDLGNLEDLQKLASTIERIKAIGK